MNYRLLADLALIVHAAFVAFVVFGWALVLWRRGLAWLHLPAVGWGAWIEFSGGICPLTPLENRWLQLAGEAGYPGGFIEHYLLATLYPQGLTRGVQIGLGTAVLVLNAGAYAWIVWRRRRAREAPPARPL
jgi:hypothetical protein